MKHQYPKNIPVLSKCMWLAVSSNVIVSVSGSKIIFWSSHWWIVFALVPSTGNTSCLLLNLITWFTCFDLDRVWYLFFWGICTWVLLKFIYVFSAGVISGFCICVGLVDFPGLVWMAGFCNGFTGWNSSVFTSKVVTIGFTSLQGIVSLYLVCSMTGCCWFFNSVDTTLGSKSVAPLSVGTTLGGLALGVALLKISDISLSTAVCVSPSITNGLDGYGWRS